MGEGQPHGEDFAEMAGNESLLREFREDYKGNVEGRVYLRNGYNGEEIETEKDAADILAEYLNDDSKADIATDPDTNSIYWRNFDSYTPAELKAIGCTLFKVTEGDSKGIRRDIDEMYRSGHAVFIVKDEDGSRIIAEQPRITRNQAEKYLQNPLETV